jgi:hypothetical protein
LWLAAPPVLFSCLVDLFVLLWKKRKRILLFCFVVWLWWFCWLFMATLLGWYLSCLILLGLQGLADLVRAHLVWLVCLVAWCGWFGSMAWLGFNWLFFFGWLCGLFLFLLFCLAG